LSGKARPDDAALELPFCDLTGKVALHLACRLPPMALDPMTFGDHMTADVDTIAVASADERLRKGLATLRKRIASAAPDWLPMAVCPQDLTRASLVSQELRKWSI
jgi:hypothetical protein